ncbi:hypothetical protein ACET3Z_000380 [Daucus carota]
MHDAPCGDDSEPSTFDLGLRLTWALGLEAAAIPYAIRLEAAAIPYAIVTAAMDIRSSRSNGKPLVRNSIIAIEAEKASVLNIKKSFMMPVMPSGKLVTLSKVTATIRAATTSNVLRASPIESLSG